MKIIILILLIFVIVTTGVFLFWNYGSENKKFVVCAWLPYWKKFDGAVRVVDNLSCFHQLSPFAFEVKEDGSLSDTLKIHEEPWVALLSKLRAQKVAVLPTILWTDSKAIHEVLSNPGMRKHHILQIVNLIEKEKFSGIDIDYEGKDMADKDIFSRFIIELATLLKPRGYFLSCTIEPRSSDFPPPAWQGVRAMSWANDYSVLNLYCDTVRIMAYDQFVQTEGSKEWHDNAKDLYSPNADIRWVEDVIEYTLRKIDRNKIILGIPTYGWMFRVDGSPGDWAYKLEHSVSYPDAIKLGQKHSVVTQRDETGELHFEHNESGERFSTWFPDSISIRQKILLAKKYQLGGITFFKIDGLEDKKMWQTVRQQLSNR